MHRAQHTIVLLTITLLSISILVGCGGSAPSPTPPVITVVQTVPVEVTRIVELPVTVEVTRQVVVTQVVEVPVTLTPTSLPVEAATSTAAPVTFVPSRLTSQRSLLEGLYGYQEGKRDDTARGTQRD
jgi:hypothetical protein